MSERLTLSSEEIPEQRNTCAQKQTRDANLYIGLHWRAMIGRVLAQEKMPDWKTEVF